MLRKCELYAIDVIKGRKTGPVPSLLKALLLPISWIYRFIVALRTTCFRLGLFRTGTVHGATVVSIGNIVAGGTGKTPFTLLLAHAFYPQHKMALISRGWRSPAGSEQRPVVLSTGHGPLYPPAEIGDEAYLLSENLPQALAYVGKDRLAAARQAQAAGAKLILLDDGLQQLQIKRDFDVILVDGNDPFGAGHMLPRGFLREPPQALRRADLIVINHVRNDAHFQQVQQRMAQYSQAPVIGTQPSIAAVIALQGEALNTLAGLNVGIFCSIAKPDYFVDMVKAAGASVVARHILPDHDLFDRDALATFSNECRAKGADILLCTEKDKVKLDRQVSISLPVAWVRMQLDISQNGALFDAFLKEVLLRLA